MKNLSDNGITFNRTQLKLIAIISMVIDHFAWGFLDFYTPLAQFLHVCGRFCIPIMCFFVAEGFRKTSNLKKYVHRMATFAIITVIPFYVFFHEEYDYRQNIIFDYLLGLLLLVVLESKKLVKWQKIALSILLFAISLTIGGWVIEPMLFILIFYYGRDFKEQAKWFCIADIGMVALLVVAISLNSVYHFSHYEWVWWDKFYLLGFMLALPLIKRYNGEKGSGIGGKYFFYIFYPAHFIVLHALSTVYFGIATPQQIYTGIHVAAFVVCWVLIILSLQTRPSKGQSSISVFLIMASLYLFGFVLETLSSTPEAYFIDCLVQYFGEFMAMISALVFIAYMCKLDVPKFVIAFHGSVAFILYIMLATTRETGLFYSQIGVNYDGPFPRPELVHNIGFYLSLAFFGCMCLEIFGMCIVVLFRGTRIDKKRVICVMLSTVGAWVPYALTVAGLTGGYEIPAVGLIFTGIFLYITFLRYGTLDSVILAGENALEHGREGIIVIDLLNRIRYHNNMVDKILGDFPHNKDVHGWPVIREVLEGERTNVEVNDRIYDFEVESLYENGLEQGKMIWIIDNTAHHFAMKEIEEYASRDSLTGLYNRTKFKELVDEDVREGRLGTFIMMDMDNFKMANDMYGHQRGDAVLRSLADILLSFGDEKMLACRIGGDEFCAYLRDNINKEEIISVLDNIMSLFSKTFRDEDAVKCSISIGAVINDYSGGILFNCSEMYSLADDKLYEAKESGKNKYVL